MLKDQKWLLNVLNIEHCLFSLVVEKSSFCSVDIEGNFHFQYINMSQRRRLIFRVSLDIISIILVASGIFSIKYGSEPYHRGFFCDDQSIQHPVLPDTIPMTLAACIGILLPLTVIIVLEFFLRKSKAGIISIDKSNTRKRSWVGAAYNTVAVFIFGMAVTQFLTEIGKFSVGRLRPHFLTLCHPDWTRVNCSAGYITENVCTSADTAKMKDARLSFPSGHSSFSMYCTMYLILYLQARISFKAAILLKPLAQLALFSLGFYTCLSRLSDYKHHWGDVFFGAFLGIAVCVCVILSLADFGQHLWSRGIVCGAENEELIPDGSQTVDENSEVPYYGTLHFESPPLGSGVFVDLPRGHTSESVVKSADSLA